MSAILKFDFQKREQLRFSEVNYLNYTKKTQFCIHVATTNVFPRTRGNKNKPWTHSTPLFNCCITDLWLSHRSLFCITMKSWHWKSRWKFLWHWKDSETTLKNIYKGNHSDNPGLSHWNIFLCCSRTMKSHWKCLNHTEKFSVLLISFVSRFFSVTLDFQCYFQCHNFIVHGAIFVCVRCMPFWYTVCAILKYF